MAVSSGKTRWSVLTGDIVNSSKLTVADRRKLLDSLTGLFDVYKTRSKNNLKLKIVFELSRGDGFQGLMDTPEQALRIALLIRTYLQSRITTGTRLIASDARIAIGIGPINDSAPTLAESDGDAFRFSGRLLDTLKKQPNLIAIKSGLLKRDGARDAELNTAFALLEGIMSKWTTSQAEVVYYKLQGYTEVVIAEILKIKQPAVSQRAKAASWIAVERLLNRFQELLAS